MRLPSGNARATSLALMLGLALVVPLSAGDAASRRSVRVDVAYARWPGAYEQEDFDHLIAPVLRQSLLDELGERLGFLDYGTHDAAPYTITFTLEEIALDYVLTARLEGENLRRDEALAGAASTSKPVSELPLFGTDVWSLPDTPREFAASAARKLRSGKLDDSWAELERKLLSRISLTEEATVSTNPLRWQIDVERRDLCIEDLSDWHIMHKVPPRGVPRLFLSRSVWDRPEGRHEALRVEALDPQELIETLENYLDALPRAGYPGQAEVVGIYLVRRIPASGAACGPMVPPEEAITQ